MKTWKSNYAPLMIATALALIMTGCRTHQKLTREGQYDDTTPVIPTFVQNLLDSAEWRVDTICVVDGKAFYFAYDNFYRTDIIYNDHEILLENPVLYYDSVSSDEKYKFKILMADKQMVVDFKDKKSLKAMSRLDTLPASFYRYRKEVFTGAENNILFSLSVDFMRPEEPYAEAVNTWLAKLVEEQISYDDIDGLKYTTYPQTPLTNEKDKATLEQRTVHRFFDNLRYEWDIDLDDETGSYFQDVWLRTWQATGKYITVLKYTHEYWSGAHGYFTEQLASYVPEEQREIDWNYLFKPECREQVLNVFFDITKTSIQNIRWDATMPNEQVAQSFMPYDEDEDEYSLDRVQMPRPGLGEKGVVFSFQPYHIGSFAEGVFHITVPYQKLTPYLTDKAKRLLDMDD